MASMRVAATSLACFLIAATCLAAEEKAKSLSQNQKTPTPNPSSATADLRPEDGGGEIGDRLPFLRHSLPAMAGTIFDPKTGEADFGIGC